jgi:AcrR family transcriptional regulator
MAAMARTQSANYPEIKTAILRTAARLFAAKGYANTSIGELTKACAVSRGALYHYFDSKEAILREMLREHIADMASRAQAAIEVSDRPEQQLRNIIRAITALNARSRNEQVVLMNDLGNLGKAEQARIRSLQTRIVDLVLESLQHADRGKRLTRRNRKVYTMLVLGMVNYSYAWYDPKGPVTPRELAEIAADLALKGFAG